MDIQHLPRIDGLQCLLESHDGRMGLTLDGCPVRTDFHPAYVDILHASVIAHPDITYPKPERLPPDIPEICPKGSV